MAPPCVLTETIEASFDAARLTAPPPVSISKLKYLEGTIAKILEILLLRA